MYRKWFKSSHVSKFVMPANEINSVNNNNSKRQRENSRKRFGSFVLSANVMY